MSRIQQLLEMLQEDPSDPFLNYALALEYGKQQKLPEAIRLIEHVLARDENYLGGYYQLGQYYEQSGEAERAISTYKKGMLIAERQKNRKAYGELNQALLMLEE